MHTSSSSISQARRFNWKQLLLSSAWLKRLRTKTLSVCKHVLKQSGISELWLGTSRACDHFLVLTDHCPPCPPHHCRRDTEQGLSWDASSSSVTEHVCACMHMCVHVHVWVVNGIILKLHYIFSIKHTISINSSTKTPMWMVYCLHLTPNFTEGEGVKEN